MTMDKIHIKDLELYCNHGVFPEENRLGQKFLISATLYTDVRKAGQTDELSQSIHYGEVSHMIKEYMEGHTFKLLESVAEGLARELLIQVPRLEKVRLELKKPWAPIGLPLDTVSVEIERGWHRAWLSIGSNMGDKKAYLDKAVSELGKLPGCEVEKLSDYLVTEPYGGVEQDEFLNGALQLRTLFTPRELLDQIHKIEAEAGRERVVRWGPRTLDIDIIFYDDLVLDEEDLHIPHIEMHKRNFVLEPLSQIAPYKRHPLLLKTVEELRGENHD